MKCDLDADKGLPFDAAHSVFPCQLPPPGWRCSRREGHKGPCAARAVTVERERYEGPVSAGHGDDSPSPSAPSTSAPVPTAAEGPPIGSDMGLGIAKTINRPEVRHALADVVKAARRAFNGLVIDEEHPSRALHGKLGEALDALDLAIGNPIDTARIMLGNHAQESEGAAREPIVWADEASPFTGEQVKALLDENERFREQLRELTARAAGHAYATAMAEGGEEIVHQELSRERADHAETRDELRVAERTIADLTHRLATALLSGGVVR